MPSPTLKNQKTFAVLSHIKKNEKNKNKNTMEKEPYHGLNHSNSLRPKDGYSINNIQSRHISTQYSLDGIMDCAICSCPTNTCTVPENKVSGYKNN